MLYSLLAVIAERTHAWSIFTSLVLLLSVTWIWFSKAPPGSTTEGLLPLPRKGFQAPDFSLESLDGSKITLSDLRGDPILVNLWASWCTPCRAEMPAMQKIYTEYQSRGFVILAVNATDQDNLADVSAFAREYHLTFPILLDAGGEVSRLYQLSALPTSFFIDDQGVVQDVVVGGPMSEALLRIRVEQLLEQTN